ncbi:hypothetical protein [Sandaracinus amylolyticus]|uniref:hypothetical protein n=1 Tax=Sandaracinus amylolyticus TaxID=927083 RepID=UPI001F36B505|nr:hypothetical protein [Sandaracinus amylolyticus]
MNLDNQHPEHRNRIMSDSRKILSAAIIQIARLSPPTAQSVQTILGGQWRRVNHGLWTEWVAAEDSTPDGVVSLSFAEMPHSTRQRASLRVALGGSSQGAEHTLQELRRSFTEWLPVVNSIPTGGSIPLVSGERTSITPNAILTIRRHNNGQPEGIFVEWLR